jgi:hypothetical protein
MAAPMPIISRPKPTKNMWFAARRSAPGDDIGRTLGLDKTMLLDHLQPSYLHLRARGTRGGEHAGGDERADRLASTSR